MSTRRSSQRENEQTLWADCVILERARIMRPGWVAIRDERIVAVGRGRPKSGERVGELLTPGLVNAHVHLDLTALSNRVPPRTDFTEWIRALVRAKAECDDEFWRASVDLGIAQSLRAGTTCVGDIDSTCSTQRLVGSPLRGVAFREWIGPTRARAIEALARIRPAPEQAAARIRVGVSPHAPYSVAKDALSAARELDVPIQMHVAETAAEVRYGADGAGPIRTMLEGFGVPAARQTAWGASPLDALEAEGLLNSRFSVAHGNFLGRAEIERLRRAGSGVVHCPGTHLLFGRERDPLAACRAERIPWGLGSDGVVSGQSLDIRAQARLGARRHSEVSAAEWFEAATASGARLLGVRAGRLRRSWFADLVAYRCKEAPESLPHAFDLWLSAATSVGGVWIGGQKIDTSSD